MLSLNLKNKPSKKFKTLIKVTMTVLLFSFVIGFIVHLLEPSAFPSLFDGVWWAIVTISTVGYGDLVPESVPGRLLTILLIIAGIALFSFFITQLSSSTILSRQEREQGMMPYKKKDHYIVVGWNERSKSLIKELQINNPQVNIVLIDHSLKKIPEGMDQLIFIKGTPSVDETFEHANVKEAHTVIITADLSIDENMADSNTILTLLTVKGMNPAVYTIVELISSQQEKNAQRAGADEIILSSNYLSHLMMTSIYSHGMTEVILEMLKEEKENHMLFEEVPHFMIENTFQQAIEQYETEDTFLLGILRDQKTLLYPAKNTKLLAGDKFILLKRETT